MHFLTSKTCHKTRFLQLFGDKTMQNGTHIIHYVPHFKKLVIARYEATS